MFTTGTSIASMHMQKGKIVASIKIKPPGLRRKKGKGRQQTGIEVHVFYMRLSLQPGRRKLYIYDERDHWKENRDDQRLYS